LLCLAFRQEINDNKRKFEPPNGIFITNKLLHLRFSWKSFFAVTLAIQEMEQWDRVSINLQVRAWEAVLAEIHSTINNEEGITWPPQCLTLLSKPKASSLLKPTIGMTAPQSAKQ